MKVLVSGGCGFIGSRLVRALLDAGHHVVVLDVQKGGLNSVRNKNLEFVGIREGHVHGGMTDSSLVRKAAENVDVVCHLALNWNGHSWRGRLPISDLFNVNVRGTVNLLEAARVAHVKHFMFASSISVYGKRTTPVTSEDEACRPELWTVGPGPIYAMVKLTTERLCLHYYHRYQLPVTVFRIDVVFDDEEYQDLELQTIQRARRGQSISVVKGEGGASIHVDDVVHAFQLAMLERKAFGQIFNLSNPAAYVSDLEVVKIVARSIGSRSRIKMLEKPALTGPRIKSVEKLQETLNWAPRRTRQDLENTISKMAKGH